MPRVKYCGNSTITEAWALVLGLPALVDETDVPLLERAARAKFPDLTRSSEVAVLPGDRSHSPPFWARTYSYDDGRHAARFGHRYLSVHYRVGEGRRYETFAGSLEPQLREWLGLYAGTMGAEAARHRLDRVGFGYVNTFLLEGPGEFDLSNYFKLNLVVDVGPAGGLLSFHTNLTFLDDQAPHKVSIDVSAVGPSDPSKPLTLQTKVVAERIGLEHSFAEVGPIVDQITAAKETAKKRFFAFATEGTHRFMQAVYE